MQKRLLLGMAAAMLCAGVAAKQPESHSARHWSYEGNESPAHWGGLSSEYAACASGKNQSPVDLSSGVQTGSSSVVFHYTSQRYRVENNGHTVQVTPAAETQSLSIDGKKFVLKQFHFHTPSEHTFKGKHFPMEAHFVHQTAAGELAVLAVMFQDGAADSALKPILAKKLKAGESVTLAQPLDITPLLPANHTHFRLNGSLTTPPCSEGVNWVVFKTPVSAAKAQIKVMSNIIGSANNRPVQPLNSRIVIEESK